MKVHCAICMQPGALAEMRLVGRGPRGADVYAHQWHYEQNSEKRQAARAAAQVKVESNFSNNIGSQQ